MPARVCILREQQRKGRRCPLPPAFGRPHGRTPPRLGRFPKSGRDEARLEVLGPPFIPSLWPGWGQFSFRRPQRGRMKGDSSPSPSLPIPSRGPDCGTIELGSPPLLRPQPSPFRGGGQNAQAAERQGTHSWAAPPAACYEPAKPSIHSLRLALSLFSLILFTRVKPFARAKLSSDFITRGLFSLQHNFEEFRIADGEEG